MATLAPQNAALSQTVHLLDSLARADGTGGHGYAGQEDAFVGRDGTRNLADLVHHLCLLHGRHPGVIDHAGNHTADSAAREWMTKAITGFAVERNSLTRLVVAAGPLPSTPGQAETDAAVLAQRHALDMLAQSDRRGCAFGAAVALVLDWWAIRPFVERAATRFSVELPACQLPENAECLETVALLADTPAIERAIIFGAQQLIGQHRGLWDLLEARKVARGAW